MKQFISLLVILLLIASCKQNSNQMSELQSKVVDIQAPIAKKEKYVHKIHGDERVDQYYWMKLSDEQKNAENPDNATKEVVAYLEAENDYTEKAMSHLEKFENDLYSEIKGRIKETDMSVPFRENGYYYLTRFEEGKEYPIYSRKKESLDADEEIMLNVNEMAEGYEYYNVGGRSISPNNKILAYGEDNVSRRIYTIKFKDLETGKMLKDEIAGTSGSAVWANDNKTIFYAVKDPVSLRSYKIFKHVLGTPSSDDKEVFHEADDTYIAFVYKTKSKEFIVAGSYATVSQEYRVLNANNPEEDFKVFTPRERGLEYSISHYKDKWYVKTNKDGAKNFKLMTTPVSSTNKDNWVDAIKHRNNVLLEGVEMFKDYMVLSERIDGITKLRVLSESKDIDRYIDFGEDACLMYTSVNPDFDTDILRLGYTSLTTPNSTFDFNMSTEQKELLKQQEVIGDFAPSDYRSERVKVKVRDGAEVPVSIVYHKDTKLDGSAPCLLYGYGSYGSSMDPYFSSVRLSLLDRGFVYAIAHIRGGEEMGRHWYEDGKLLNKMNTFNDFVDCGKYLVEKKYSHQDNLFAMGGSAGGLLMGAVINQAPDLWKGAVAQVPFVDVVTTMLDESIPLTTGEYDEWGNPNEEQYYHYMKSYSPYDNIEAKDYPALLVTTGYFDSQVQYWEPAKWVAKLRANKTDQNPLLFKTNMGAGHGGASGRFQRFKEIATEYAFLCDLAGKVDQELD